MLDPAGDGCSLEIRTGDTVAAAWTPVVVARSTAYGAASACELITQWPPEIARPWLVVVADAPTRPPTSARFYLRAVRNRTAGIARVPYLPALRAAVRIGQVLDDPSVSRAGHDLRLRLSGQARPASVVRPRASDASTSRREDL
jgi:hypothetical protein